MYFFEKKMKLHVKWVFKIGFYAESMFICLILCLKIPFRLRHLTHKILPQLGVESLASTADMRVRGAWFVVFGQSQFYWSTKKPRIIYILCLEVC